MFEFSTSPNRRRVVQAGAVALVALLHVGLFAAVGLSRVPLDRMPVILPINVELIPPEVPVPPPPPPPPERPVETRPGGGAPANPSRVHVTPTPPARPPELPLAPPTPAPSQTLVIGAAPIVTPGVGLGQGGTGTGTGAGEGEGDGPGSGTGPQFLRGASNGEILGLVPAEARRQRRAGRAVINCVIRADTRLDQCRVADESPAGFGFGDAGVRVVETYFRFRAPTTASGRVIDSFRVTVTVNFGRQ